MTEEQSQASDPRLDEDGFLKTIAGWNRSMAATLAEKNDIGPLTEGHWQVIEYVKSYFETHASGPPVVKICKATGLSREEICELFPCGVARGAYRLAGLPRPSGCL